METFSIPTPTAAERLALPVVQAGAVAVVLVALLNAAFDLDRFLVPKELALHGTAVLVGLLAFRAIRRTIGGRIDLMIVIYLLLSALSAVMATNRWLGIRALAVSASGIVLLWIARGLKDAGLSRPLLNALALAVVIASVTSLLQAYGLRIDLFALNRSPGGTLGNRNFVAHVAAFGLPLLFYVALSGRFVLGSFGVAIVTASLVLTRSRAAWLATAVMLLIFIVSARMWRRLAGVLVFAVVGAAAALVIPNTLHWRGANPYLQSVTGVANYEEGSGRGRLVQYTRSLIMAATHPIFGVGPGNWPVKYPRYSLRNDPSVDSDRMTFNPWPSSDWIAFVSERGPVAAVLMALIFIGIALAGSRHENRLLKATLLAMLAAAIVEGMFDAVLLLAAPTLIVWTAIGALWPVEQRPALGGWRLAIPLFVIGIAAVGAFRSASQIVAMEMYVTGGRASLVRAAQIDPGNYRIQLRLAQRCEHARAAHALFPEAAEAAALARHCGR
ncbi:MAG TPA: O-antigen ligase family protein [Thermoanaerobaculia bacterium]|nr:O-antigen ligase family protein [Thermoanaerobaculia bacterium]